MLSYSVSVLTGFWGRNDFKRPLPYAKRKPQITVSINISSNLNTTQTNLIIYFAEMHRAQRTTDFGDDDYETLTTIWTRMLLNSNIPTY